jgi:hypothetical protein
MKSGMLVWDGRTLTSTRKGSYVQRCRYGAGVEKGGWKKDSWMQHRDFPGGHPSQYYSGPKALNFRVLMGSGVVALV